MSHSGKENMQFINILTQETENRVICAWRWTLSSCKNSPPLMTKPLLDLSRGKLGDILINFLSRARGNLQPSKCFWTSQKKTPSLWLELTSSYPNVFGFLEFFWGDFFYNFFSLFCFGFLINSLFLAPAIQMLSQREQLNCPWKTSPDTSMHFKLTSN